MITVLGYKSLQEPFGGSSTLILQAIRDNAAHHEPYNSNGRLPWMAGNANLQHGLGEHAWILSLFLNHGVLASPLEEHWSVYCRNAEKALDTLLFLSCIG